MVLVTESTSLKNESGMGTILLLCQTRLKLKQTHEDSSFPVSTSLKNESVGYVGRLEIVVYEDSSFYCVNLVKK